MCWVVTHQPCNISLYSTGFHLLGHYWCKKRFCTSQQPRVGFQYRFAHIRIWHFFSIFILCLSFLFSTHCSPLKTMAVPHYCSHNWGCWYRCLHAPGTLPAHCWGTASQGSTSVLLHLKLCNGEGTKGSTKYSMLISLGRSVLKKTKGNKESTYFSNLIPVLYPDVLDCRDSLNSARMSTSTVPTRSWQQLTPCKKFRVGCTLTFIGLPKKFWELRRRLLCFHFLLLYSFITISNFIPFSCKACKKMKPRGFALCWPCNTQPRSWLLKKIEANSTCKHSRYEKIWLKTLCVMFSIKDG